MVELGYRKIIVFLLIVIVVALVGVQVRKLVDLTSLGLNSLDQKQQDFLKERQEKDFFLFDAKEDIYLNFVAGKGWHSASELDGEYSLDLALESEDFFKGYSSRRDSITEYYVLEEKKKEEITRIQFENIFFESTAFDE